ncbi:MAG: mannose-1-phosphate guanylyltransferase [Bdellovibrionota bacterium]
MNPNVYMVIMAGGGGTRFWPLGKKAMPKQFLSISKNGVSMIANTANRAKRFTNNDVHVVTNKKYADLVRSHINNARIICEPVAKNTAPPIGLAALYLLKQNKDAIMIVCPSDHVIKNLDKLIEIYKEAIALAESRKTLITIGVTPEYPHTGYGYIKMGEHISNNSYTVERFVEKPKLELAKEYIATKKYLWNSGIFVWRADVILRKIKEYMPNLYENLMVINEAIGTPNENSVIEEYFPKIEAQSIDYGVMEKAKDVCIVKADNLCWNDVGSLKEWGDNFSKDSDGNVNVGNGLLINTKNSICFAESDIPTFLLNVENVIVVNTGKEVLVCDKDTSQDVKLIVEELKKQNREDLL